MAVSPNNSLIDSIRITYSCAAGLAELRRRFQTSATVDPSCFPRSKLRHRIKTPCQRDLSLWPIPVLQSANLAAIRARRRCLARMKGERVTIMYSMSRVLASFQSTVCMMMKRRDRRLSHLQKKTISLKNPRMSRMSSQLIQMSNSRNHRQLWPSRMIKMPILLQLSHKHRLRLSLSLTIKLQLRVPKARQTSKKLLQVKIMRVGRQAKWQKLNQPLIFRPSKSHRSRQQMLMRNKFHQKICLNRSKAPVMKTFLRRTGQHRIMIQIRMLTTRNKTMAVLFEKCLIVLNFVI